MVVYVSGNSGVVTDARVSDPPLLVGQQVVMESKDGEMYRFQVFDASLAEEAASLVAYRRTVKSGARPSDEMTAAANAAVLLANHSGEMKRASFPRHFKNNTWRVLLGEVGAAEPVVIEDEPSIVGKRLANAPVVIDGDIAFVAAAVVMSAEAQAAW
jgi:hypothetical protein